MRPGGPMPRPMGPQGPPFMAQGGGPPGPPGPPPIPSSPVPGAGEPEVSRLLGVGSLLESPLLSSSAAAEGVLERESTSG